MTDIEEVLSNGFEMRRGEVSFRQLSEISLTIIRGDIHHFFDGIDKKIMSHLLFSGNEFSREEELLIKEMLLDNSIRGLPQGNPISSVFAEIYLNNFDHFIRLEFEPLLYERFVDDFIIIVPNFYDWRNNKEKVKEVISSRLAAVGLEISREKFSVTDTTEDHLFDFLGYSFSANKLDGKDKYLEVSMSDQKLKKYWRKIYRYFRAYQGSKMMDVDFTKLRLKIENVFSGIITVDKRGKKERIGLPYGYSNANGVTKLKSLYDEVVFLSKKVGLSSQQFKIIMKIIMDYRDVNIGAKLSGRRVNYIKMSRHKLDETLRDLGGLPRVNESTIAVIQQIFTQIYR
ncbi:RNA-directed DNA polymerase [Secundilactobacillus kimchicus]|uniref:RNA-directed DNA polymerase n=1 Tax=Secundilactobacillus kimchicus TaxID=528209 RepID=UPI001C02BB21